MSFRKTPLAATAAIAALAVAGGAHAAVVLVTPQPGAYTEVLPANPLGAGVYGVEARGGRAGAADWEIGVGKGTSQPGFFNQGEYNWLTATTDHAFTLVWTPTALSFTVGGRTVTDTPTISRPNTAAPFTGNTLKVYVKGLSQLTVASVDGTAFNTTFTSGQTGYFFSNNAFGGDGFTATGTMRITPNGGSRHEVMFKSGTIAVPEPGTWALMIGGFGLAGAALRAKRRQARAVA